jgi:hypothetical protein
MDNTADLLLLGGHDASVLKRFYEMTVSSVARALHLDAGLEPAQVRDRLRRIGEDRGVSVDLDAVHERVRSLAAEGPRAASMLKTAGEIHRWKREMTHGL